MADCLVLNADYTPLSALPLSTISWKDSIKQCWLESVAVVDYYKNWKVNSPSTTLNVPSVVVSKKFVKKKQSVRFSRYNLLVRDNFCCQYCYDELTLKDMTIDHVLPRARGGTTKWDNVVASCYTCNSIKGHRTNMKPKVKPIKPDYYNLLGNIQKLPIEIPDESWIPFLGWDRSLITVRPPKKNIEL